MSRVELYVERKNGDVEPNVTIPNPFAGAVMIWMEMAERYGYLPPKGDRDRDLAVGKALSDPTGGAFAQLWQGCAKIAKTSPRDAYVLALTFDRVLLPHAVLARVATYLREWLADYRPGNQATLLALANQLDLYARRRQSDVVSVGFNHTSVSSPFWVIETPSAEDPETYDARPYNTRRDEGHWYLGPTYFEELAASEASEEGGRDD